MAILSFIVNCDLEHVNEVVAKLEKMPHLELHGVHNGYQVVVVMDTPSDIMEAKMAEIQSLEYVNTCEVSYCNVEEDLEKS